MCVLYYICSTLDNLAGSCSSSTQYTYYVHTTTVQGRGRGRRNKGRHRNTLRAAELLGSDSAGLLPLPLLQLVHTFFVQQTDRDLSPSAKPTNERANLAPTLTESELLCCVQQCCYVCMLYAISSQKTCSYFILYRILPTKIGSVHVISSHQSFSSCCCCCMGIKFG